MDILSFILGFKKGIASGGGGGATVDPVHTVTFMSWDGSEVLGQRSVVDGDNCADMVARGEWGTPTRESTPQYNYTYAGWSQTSGGSASSSALSAVTADRTVYAAFTSTVRYYTITYYDGDTLLKSESLAYGATPSYEPEKEGYFFEGWEPELSAVTGDATYTAKWKETITFATGSWTDISNISANGEAESYFKVGDTRDIPITYADGTTGTLKVAIAGFNHDDLADGSGKAGISIVCMTMPNITTAWSTTTDWNGYGSSGSYADALLVKTTLNGTILPMLPNELVSVIKPVNKKSDGSMLNTQTSTETLWPLSALELGHDGSTYTASNYTVSTGTGTGQKYELFKSGNVFGGMLRADVMIPIEGETAYSYYWTRSVVKTKPTGSTSTYAVGAMGFSGYDNTKAWLVEVKKTYTTSTKYAIRFGFCI